MQRAADGSVRGRLGAGNQRRCIRGRSHLIVHRDAMVRPAVHLLFQVAPRRRRRPVHVRPVRAQRDVVDVPGGAWPRGRPLLAVGALPLCARPAAVRRLPRAKDGAGREGRRTNGRRDLVKELLELLLGSGLVDRPVGGGCGAGPGAERGVGHVHQGLVDCGPGAQLFQFSGVISGRQICWRAGAHVGCTAACPPSLALRRPPPAICGT